MPSVHPPAKVLVTGVSSLLDSERPLLASRAYKYLRLDIVAGATGFIGTWTARAFLERGYDVRGTVRSKSKGDWLVNQPWAKIGPGKFEYFIVEDIQVLGAFDDAVKGDITVVAHTASPVIFDPQLDPSDLINPAVKGTVGILDSIVAHGPSVKRVVITSSVATVTEPTEDPRVFTEGDQNNFSLKDIETKGAASEPIHKYRASKVKSEKAVWDFVEKHKGEINFEVTTIHPSFVYGPIIHQVASVDRLNESIKIFLGFIRNEVPPTEFSLGNYVDVRDVAKLHVDAVENDKAGGERFLASAGTYIWQDIYDALNTHSDPFIGVPVGTPEAGKKVIRILVAYSNEKAKSVLGFKFTSLGDMSYDTLASLKERGFW